MAFVIIGGFDLKKISTGRSVPVVVKMLWQETLAAVLKDESTAIATAAAPV
jgi:hypothetical protein